MTIGGLRVACMNIDHERDVAVPMRVEAAQCAAAGLSLQTMRPTVTDWRQQSAMQAWRSLLSVPGRVLQPPLRKCSRSLACFVSDSQLQTRHLSRSWDL